MSIPQIDRDLSGKRIAVLATDGFEYSELTGPRDGLARAGAKVDVITPKGDSIKGWKGGNWADPVEADLSVADADPGIYHALVLPGGVINPDKLRIDEAAMDFIKAMATAGKPIGAICHGPWLLVEAGLVKGRRVTSWKSIRRDLENAGGQWEDSEVVVDGAIITSRNPDDIPAFTDAVAKAALG